MNNIGGCRMEALIKFMDNVLKEVTTENIDKVIGLIEKYKSKEKINTVNDRGCFEQQLLIPNSLWLLKYIEFVLCADSESLGSAINMYLIYLNQTPDGAEECKNINSITLHSEVNKALFSVFNEKFEKVKKTIRI